jgi:hypothetical protein
MAATGCDWFSPTKVRVRVVEHQTASSGEYYELLYVVLAPEHLKGKYDVDATLRKDLIESVDGREFEIWLNFTMAPTLGNRPLAYSTSAPSPGDGDFLDSATPVVDAPARSPGGPNQGHPLDAQKDARQ